MDPDIEARGSFHPGIGGCPVEQCVPQPADLGGPGRVIHGHYQRICIDPDRLDVLGHRRTDDLRPPREESAEAVRSLDPEPLGEGIQRPVEGSWFGVPAVRGFGAHSVPSAATAWPPCTMA